MKATNVAIAALKSWSTSQAKLVRDELPVGVNLIDEEVTVRLKGTVTVGEDEDYVPTGKIPLKAALALFLRYSGATGNVALNALERAMKEAIELDEDAEESIQEIALIAEAEARITKMINNLPTKKRRGKVSVKVVAT